MIDKQTLNELVWKEVKAKLEFLCQTLRKNPDPHWYDDQPAISMTPGELINRFIEMMEKIV